MTKNILNYIKDFIRHFPYTFNNINLIAIVTAITLTASVIISNSHFSVLSLVVWYLMSFIGTATLGLIAEQLFFKHRVFFTHNFITKWAQPDDSNEDYIRIPPGATMQVTVDRATGLVEYEIIEG